MVVRRTALSNSQPLSCACPESPPDVLLNQRDWPPDAPAAHALRAGEAAVGRRAEAAAVSAIASGLQHNTMKAISHRFA
jgi:hypothetical protein